MDGHIGHLHCRYRAIAGGSASPVTLRLDRVAQNRVLQFCEEALQQVLGDDPTVYVLRRVEATLALGVEKDQSDARLAEQWGQHLAGAVMRAVAGDPDDVVNLIRFTDQAEYVSRFVADLLQGQAWNRWYYGAFASLRALSARDALRTVLLDNMEHLPGILVYLHAEGMLSVLLSALDRATLELLWSQGLSGYLRSDPEPLRVPFMAALGLVDRLNLWSEARLSMESLFQAYVSSAPRSADWRDRISLTMALIDAFRFLSQRGHIARRSTQSPAELSSAIDRALTYLDWLDVERLRAFLLEFLSWQGIQQSGLPVRRVGSQATPRQAALMEDLAHVLRQGGSNLNYHQIDSLENYMRLYAALLAYAPRWADDSSVSRVIQRLLTSAAALKRTPSGAQAIAQLRRGRVVNVLEGLQGDERAEVAESVEVLASMGQPAIELMDILVGEQGDHGAGWEVGFETSCAGVFLMLRAVMDARLPYLVEASGLKGTSSFTPLGMMLVSLGLRWAGQGWDEDEAVDPALQVFAGITDPLTVGDLRNAWSESTREDQARFLGESLRLLAAHRVDLGPALRLYNLPMSGGEMVLVMGDDISGHWPLGRVLRADEQISTIVAQWIHTWEQATGSRVELVTADQSLSGLSVPTRLAFIPKALETSAEHSSNDTSLVDLQGKERLRASLASLEPGQLLIPDVDLTVSLMAISLLRVWARWLRCFSDSSVPFLLGSLIRRAGRVLVTDTEIFVKMDSKPLDVILNMAGYTADLERVSWLGNRRVRFQVLEAQ